MSRVALTLVLISALPLLGQETPPAPASERPRWIEAVPRSPGRLYAIGMAELGLSEGQAKARAGDRAKLEVVAQLRSTVKGQTVITQQAEETQTGDRATRTGQSRSSFAETVAITAEAEQLPGLAVEQTYVDVAGRTAYALAVLDLEPCARGLQERLKALAELRRRGEREASRRALWRLRRALDDLDRLQNQVGLLAPAGLDPAIGEAATTERERIEVRLQKLEAMKLPPLEVGQLTFAFRPNLTLPAHLEAWIEARLQESGLRLRSAGADLILELAFQGGSRGPELIFPEGQYLGTITYRIEATASLKDKGGLVLGRSAPISLAQEATAQGLVQAFQRTFLLRLSDLLDQLSRELE